MQGILAVTFWHSAMAASGGSKVTYGAMKCALSKARGGTRSISFFFRSWKVKSEKHFKQIDSQIHSWRWQIEKWLFPRKIAEKLFLHNQGQCTKSEMKSSLKRQNQRWKYYNLICFWKIPFILRFAHGGGFFLTGKGKVLEWPGVELWPGLEQDFEVNWPQLTRHSPHRWEGILFQQR